MQWRCQYPLGEPHNPNRYHRGGKRAGGVMVQRYCRLVVVFETKNVLAEKVKFFFVWQSCVDLCKDPNHHYAKTKDTFIFHISFAHLQIFCSFTCFRLPFGLIIMNQASSTKRLAHQLSFPSMDDYDTFDEGNGNQQPNTTNSTSWTTHEDTLGTLPFW